MDIYFALVEPKEMRQHFCLFPNAKPTRDITPHVFRRVLSSNRKPIRPWT